MNHQKILLHIFQFIQVLRMERLPGLGMGQLPGLGMVLVKTLRTIFFNMFKKHVISEFI